MAPLPMILRALARGNAVSTVQPLDNLDMSVRSVGATKVLVRRLSGSDTVAVILFVIGGIIILLSLAAFFYMLLPFAKAKMQTLQARRAARAARAERRKAAAGGGGEEHQDGAGDALVDTPAAASAPATAPAPMPAASLTIADVLAQGSSVASSDTFPKHHGR